MKYTIAKTVLLACLIPVTGCGIWFGEGDDDDDDCYLAGDIAAYLLRNPQTGQCEDFGYPCDDWCNGPCPAEGAVAEPDWAMCYGACEGLDEETCQDTSGCRAIYVGDCPEGLDCGNTTYTFQACWPTAPSGPVQGGDCFSFDAYECSRHDDCVANHYPFEYECPPNADCAAPDPTVPGNFEYCSPEPEPPGGSCYGQVLCDSIPPECPAGTVPAIEDGCWSGACIAFGDCDPPIDPGSCYEVATCRSLPPPCPEGSVPGVYNGCWTGYCIPMEQCEPGPECADVQSEYACVERPDCTAIYEGVNCECAPDGSCTCEDWLFQSCE